MSSLAGTPSRCAARSTSARRALAAARRSSEPPWKIVRLRRGQPLVGRRRGVAHHHLDPVERHVELFGGHLRKRGPRAGAEIDLAAEDRDAVVGADGEPRIDCFLGHRLRRAQRRGAGRAGRPDIEKPTARMPLAFRNARRSNEVLGHELSCSPPVQAAAARFTAATMRLWVPQRQRLSASAARMSASLGLLFFASSAAEVMIMPLTQ